MPDPNDPTGEMLAGQIRAQRGRADPLELTDSELRARGLSLMEGALDPQCEITIRERFTYHPPTPYRAELHDKLTEAAITFALRIDSLCRPSRERTLAIEAVATARMQANAALAIHGAPNTTVKDAKENEEDTHGERLDTGGKGLAK